jgi:ATP-dependent protease ClpP protease subunit
VRNRLPSNLGRLRAAWRAAEEIEARSVPSWRLANADGNRPRLYVYDVIGGWDLDAAEFVRAVHAIEADDVDLHINSPGGFVWDAVAMYEALDAHPAAVHVHIDGLAASAASFMAMVGADVEIAKGGRMMIHDAQGIGIGGPADMREYADLLDAVSDDISGYYAARAGGTPKTWRQAMTATTWYSAQESVDAKLADRVAARGGGDKDEPEDIRSQTIRARHRARITMKG